MKMRNDRIDLSDVTALITVRIDSPERKANLMALIKILLRDYKIKIYVLEADTNQKIHVSKYADKIGFRYISDSDQVFHRTKYFKLMEEEIQTPYFAIWDADIIAIPVQIQDAIIALREEKALMSLPYDGRVCSLDHITSSLFRKYLNYEILENFANSMPLIFGYQSVGGLCFLNRLKYLENGGENTRFYGWGPEDIERLKRYELLDLAIYKSRGYLFHMYHQPKQNSWYYNSACEIIARKEFLHLCSRTE